ncbi:MAG: Re/Si-specific NAD(P)(+) transhydrogenase subunit alpha [Bacteroidetes bacterium]|nr:Re/Si-specific NAD(P)(+) transhydrogenase subunit alpha [Bacteroidota bacterium]
MKLGIPKELNDRRVAIVPSTLPKFKALGLEILIEKGAGEKAMFSDEDFSEHARIVSREDLILESDILLSINPMTDEEMKKLKENTLIVSQFRPFFDKDVIDKLKGMKLRAFSLDMIPRTTLAQSMDVLSSMASVAGYKAVLVAAEHLPRYFPMMITAAGSIRPAKALILGAGVAGLQAIATARRLGAMVEAFDTRSAAKEEVKSLGAKFVEVEGAKEDTGAGGYAVEQSEEFLKRQREEVQKRAMKSDIIITTAQVRGRKAPLLVPKETVEGMTKGSVIVDLAASTGGNCELTKDNEVVNHKGVFIVGDSELSARMPQDASLMFSNNVLNFMKLYVKEGKLELNMEDEIISGSLITKEEESKDKTQ